MRSKPTVIANLTYKRVGQQRSLRDLCKYLQFRDGSIRRDAYLRGEGYGGPEVGNDVRPSHRPAKWVDRGMGESYSQIANQAHDLRGRSVLVRTWVISPDPDLMQHVPEDQRLEVMQCLAERQSRWQAEQRAALEQARQEERQRRERLRQRRARGQERPEQERTPRRDGLGLELDI